MRSLIDRFITSSISNEKDFHNRIKGNKGKLKTQWFEDCFSDVNNVLYLNKKKAQTLTSLGVQFSLRDANGLSLFDTSNILHEEDLVKAKFKNPQLYQDNAQVKGSFNPTMQDGQYVISLFKGADASTVIYETGHYFLETMWQSVFQAGKAFAEKLCGGYNKKANL